jgi:hypothetical protein
MGCRLYARLLLAKKNVIGKYRKNLKHFIENTPKIAPNPYFVIMDPSVLSLNKKEKKNTSSLKYMEIIPMK